MAEESVSASPARLRAPGFESETPRRLSGLGGKPNEIY
jgi:hypothetical protein